MITNEIEDQVRQEVNFLSRSVSGDSSLCNTAQIELIATVWVQLERMVKVLGKIVENTATRVELLKTLVRISQSQLENFARCSQSRLL